MGKPKVPKPQTVSKQQVATHQKQLNKLQRQMAAANKRNLQSIAALTQTQQVAQEANVQQLSLLQQSALQQAAAPAEPPEEQLAGIRTQAELVSRAQSDTIESRAIAEYRARQQTDSYARRKLVNAALRR
jgi:hypothetical protein